MIFLFVTTQRDGYTLRIYSWGICCGYDILAEVGANQGNYLVVLVCRGLRGGFRERSVAIWSFFNLALIRASTGVN